jgi:polysaccharide deacetylase family protein (PEP-CTERM system associated)
MRVPKIAANLPPGSDKTDAGSNLLTIMVEDYFHVRAFEGLIQQRNWRNFEPRYARNTLKTLDLLDRYSTKATFFVLSWIAESNPTLVREITERGHEVAIRGVYQGESAKLTPEEFRDDLRRTRQALEEACGQRVVGFRAAEKLSFDKSRWVLDMLAAEGFAYDASFVPTFDAAPRERVAHQARTSDGRTIWEFPYAALDLGLSLLPISGGNYFRQLPYTLMRQAVKGWHKRHQDPFVFYFHVWELDPEQPRISAASKINRIRHYRKLDKMEWILHENLALYKCTGIADHLGIKARKIEAPARSHPESSIEISSTARASLKPVSIVIPCYNEQESLPYLAKTLASVGKDLRATGYEPHLIFVDDKSEDNTLEVINAQFGSQRNVRVLRHHVNRGVAAGIVTGIAAAETEIVCSIDCDCTFDPHDLVKMIPMLTDGVDMVTASPYHKDGGVRNVPGWRLQLSKGASAIYSRILRTKLASYTSCFRVYRRSSMVDLDPAAPGFHGVAEMLGLLDLKGGQIIEFPTILTVRLFGISKMKTVKTIAGHIKLMSRLAAMRWLGKGNAAQSAIDIAGSHTNGKGRRIEA